MTKKTNPDFLNGVPELLVLQLLARRPMYGYQLVRSIERSTGQVLEFGEGCIYPVLHRLEADGHLAAKARNRPRPQPRGLPPDRHRPQTPGRQHRHLAQHRRRRQPNSAGRQSMNIQQPREQFEAELRRHRLPRAYIERLLAEWDDHLQDLQEERSTDMARTPDIVNFAGATWRPRPTRRRCRQTISQSQLPGPPSNFHLFRAPIAAHVFGVYDNGRLARVIRKCQ